MVLVMLLGVPFSPLVPPGTLEAVVNTTAVISVATIMPCSAVLFIHSSPSFRNFSCSLVNSSRDTSMAVQNSNVKYAFVRFILSED
ncbi:hypothetical protein QQP08_004991 [Theobroma cacao]|nr:hypothetical protein QQP08_004991 [Theobroma cacao]